MFSGDVGNFCPTEGDKKYYSFYNNQFDCDGDKITDYVCTNKLGNIFGILSSDNQNCENTWNSGSCHCNLF